MIKRVYTQPGAMIWARTVDRLQYALTTLYWSINHGERARFIAAGTEGVSSQRGHALWATLSGTTDRRDLATLESVLG